MVKVNLGYCSNFLPLILWQFVPVILKWYIFQSIISQLWTLVQWQHQSTEGQTDSVCLFTRVLLFIFSRSLVGVSSVWPGGGDWSPWRSSSRALMNTKLQIWSTNSQKVFGHLQLNQLSVIVNKDAQNTSLTEEVLKISCLFSGWC